MGNKKMEKKKDNKFIAKWFNICVSLRILYLWHIYTMIYNFLTSIQFYFRLNKNKSKL